MLLDKLYQVHELVKNLDGSSFTKHGNFAWDPEWGYMNSCPSNWGTGMRASYHVDMSNYLSNNNHNEIKTIAKKYGLSARPEGGEGSKWGNIWDLGPNQRLGINESQIISQLILGFNDTIKELKEKHNPSNKKMRL